MQPHHLVGACPAQSTPRPAAKSLYVTGDDLDDRAPTRERSALGDPHQRALGADVVVPHLGIGRRLLESGTRNTVELLGLTGVPPNRLWRIDIVHAPVQLGMQRLDVIGLAETVGDRLPIRVDIHGHGRVAAEVTEPEPGDVVRHRLQIVGQRRRVEIEIDEDQSLPGVDADREQRKLGQEAARRILCGSAPV